MKTWLIALALALPAAASAQDAAARVESVRAAILRDVEVYRGQFLPRTEPPTDVTVRFEPTLDDIKRKAFAAAGADEISSARQDLEVWRLVVLGLLSKTPTIGGLAPEPKMPAPSLPSAGARRAQTRTDSTRAAATKPAEGLFDGGSSRKKAAETPAPVYADLPADEAVRYRKMRDIAVKEWGASPRIVDAAIAEALRQGVDPSLVLSVIWQESRFHSKATSPVGARGLMQVMPETGKGLGVKDPDMLYDVKTNLRAGIKYLKIAGKKFGIDDISNVMDDSFAKVKALLASYNAGMGAVSRWLKTQGGELVRIPYKETRKYVAAIGAKLESLWEALG